MIDEGNLDPIRENIGEEKSFLAKTFSWMFMGLLTSGVIGAGTYYTGFLWTIIFSGLIIPLCIAEILVVLVFSVAFRKLSAKTVGILYFVYAAINGLTLSTIFVVYEMDSIILIFFVAAALFGVFAYLGSKIKMDLSSLGKIFLGVLIAGIIMTIINLFLKIPGINIVLDWIILITFFGITAYDVQKIQRMGTSELMDPDKMHIYGAMQIYLDFINIFLRLLSLFGKRRN